MMYKLYSITILGQSVMPWIFGSQSLKIRFGTTMLYIIRKPLTTSINHHDQIYWILYLYTARGLILIFESQIPHLLI